MRKPTSSTVRSLRALLGWPCSSPSERRRATEKKEKSARAPPEASGAKRSSRKVDIVVRCSEEESKQLEECEKLAASKFGHNAEGDREREGSRSLQGETEELPRFGECGSSLHSGIEFGWSRTSKGSSGGRKRGVV
jgi:hypothetical protein